MNIHQILQDEFNLKKTQIENTISLIDEGNTIPFIARYRKELTGSLDDQILREFYERLQYLRNLNEKKEQTRKLIEEQDKMTEEISIKIDNAKTLTEIDDIYRPFRPKRRTRATIAKEKGLQPLADIIITGDIKNNIDESAIEFIDSEKGVNDVNEAIQGAKDIIAEIIADDSNCREIIRSEILKNGLISSKASKKEENSVYEMYFDFSEPIKKIAGHRILALNRAEKEGIITVKLEVDSEVILNKLCMAVIRQNQNTKEILTDVVDDSYKRLIFPSVEREIRNSLTEKAEIGAIKVFSENLKQLLMQAPIKDNVVLAIDPGFRTGCKIAVVDETGKVLDTGVIYPTAPQNKTEESKKKLIPLIEKHNVKIIAIGNGTASRETETFVVEMMKELNITLHYIIVNEAGASVYSASKLGAEEFSDFDVALRSAVSIARRLQDPLAELVKIDPKSIGVGQYQHDMNEKRLSETLSGVVESCVNNVGVDLNTASHSLLSYVSGLSSSVSKNIQQYREENGKFNSRKELLKVKKLGAKAFEQCAGFLRISDGQHILDNTGVHPESYIVAEKLIKIFEYTLEDIKNKKIRNIASQIPDLEELAGKLEIGVPTLLDIIKELEKPGRDPREDLPKPILRSDVLSMQDLKEGMILQGTVRNVIDFGVFVDIGVHQDGLVHISQITDRFIKHPLEAVAIGDIVNVKIISIDISKKRISLSIKQTKNEAKNA